MRQQGDDAGQHRRRFVPPVEDGAFRRTEGLVADVADVAALLFGRHSNLAFCHLPAGGTVAVGAEGRCRGEGRSFFGRDNQMSQNPGFLTEKELLHG